MAEITEYKGDEEVKHDTDPVCDSKKAGGDAEMKARQTACIIIDMACTNNYIAKKETPDRMDRSV